MSANHGNTPAAWTAVTLVLVAFIVSGTGMMMENWPIIWVGAALVPVGLLAGVILSKMGYGESH